MITIKEDIQENLNLSNSNKDKTRQMAATLTNYLKNANAQMPAYKLTKKKVPWPTSIFETID